MILLGVGIARIARVGITSALGRNALRPKIAVCCGRATACPEGRSTGAYRCLPTKWRGKYRYRYVRDSDLVAFSHNPPALSLSVVSFCVCFLSLT